MADPTTMLTSLAPVVVGGVLAFAGGFVAQWWSQKLQAEAENRRRRAAKFEELMLALYEFEHWLDEARNHRVIGMGESPPMSPFAKVRAICSLYFPQFSDRINELGLAADDFEMWMFKAAKKRFEAGGTQVFNDGHVEARHPYLKA